MVDELIDKLGGVRTVAEAVNSTPGAVANWRLRKTIPWRHRHVIARVAAERGIALPDSFWADPQQDAAA